MDKVYICLRDKNIEYVYKTIPHVTYTFILGILETTKCSLKELTDTLIREEKVRNFHYLYTNNKENAKHRKKVYESILKDIDFPEGLYKKYYSYMDTLHPMDRYTYLDKLEAMTKKTLKQHIIDMYINPISELDEELEEEFGSQKRSHKDLYDFHRDPIKMVLLTTAFLRKVRVNLSTKNKLYIKYSDVDVDKLKKKKSYDLKRTKSLILVGFIKYLVSMKKRDMQVFIDNLFDPEYFFVQLELKKV